MFNCQEDVSMQIPQATGLEDLERPRYRLEDGAVPVEEMRSEVFEHVISDVLDPIQKHLQQSQVSNAIFMVGGFGSSHWMSVSGKNFHIWLV